MTFEGHVRMLLLEVTGDSCCCLAEYSQMMQNPSLHKLIVPEGVEFSRANQFDGQI